MSSEFQLCAVRATFSNKDFWILRKGQVLCGSACAAPGDSKVLPRSTADTGPWHGAVPGPGRDSLSHQPPVTLPINQDCKWHLFTNSRVNCTVQAVKMSFKSTWAGPLSTTNVINNWLPGSCVDKLNSFHHLRHPHLLPSQAHVTSPRTSKFISQTPLRGRRKERGISVFT